MIAKDCTERLSAIALSVGRIIPRLFTVPYFFVRSFRHTASYRHGYLDFQMYRGGGRRGHSCKMAARNT